MITLWVKSRSTPHPRRLHRLRMGESRTICGLWAWMMTPVSEKMPKPCHVCFKYDYRYDSINGRRR